MTEPIEYLSHSDLLALTEGQHVEVDIAARTYHGPLIDPRHGWLPGTVAGVSETLNGEVNLWVDIAYPEGLTGADGSTIYSYRLHFTADSYNVRPTSL